MKFCSVSGCENLVEGRTEMCATHNHEQRKAMKQARNIKVVAPVKKVSSQRQKDQAEYNILRELQLKEFPKCQIKLKGICTVIAIQVHHSAKRGKNYLNKGTFLSACDECHKHLETKLSAAERREKGLLK